MKISVESDTSSCNKSNLFLMEFMFRCAIIRLFLHESHLFCNIDVASDLASEFGICSHINTTFKISFLITIRYFKGAV